MFKLAPILAYAYVFKLVALDMTVLHQSLMKDTENGDFKQLEITHHLAAGYKSFNTAIVYDSLDKLRQACGGAGFNSFSGLPLLVQDYSPNTTFEGDNTVMAQQSSRLLIKNIKSLQKGFKPTGIFAYLNKMHKATGLKCVAKNPKQVLDVDIVEEALFMRTVYQIKTTFEKLMRSQASENEKTNSLFAVDIIKMAQYHIMLT